MCWLVDRHHPESSISVAAHPDRQDPFAGKGEPVIVKIPDSDAARIEQPVQGRGEPCSFDPAEANLKHNGKSWQLAAGVTEQWVGFERTVSQQEEPIVLKAKARWVPQWKMQRGKNPASGQMVAAMAEPPPESPVTTDGPEVDVELVPFGCTRLRVAEFPTVAMPRAIAGQTPRGK